MNFFEHQDQARRNTTLLIGLFFVAIAAMILAFYCVALGFYYYALFDGGTIASSDGYAAVLSPIRPGMFLLVAVGTLSLVSIGSLHKIIQLRGGGKVVALSMGAYQVDPQTDDEDLRRLLNVVEEMAIASGIPVPPVYMMYNEKGINAFAAGFTVNDAVVGVTWGCVQELSRDELQGVIAHEFSHILNGDMRLNLRIIGVLQGILIIFLIGRVMLRGGVHGGRGGGGFALLGLGIMAIGGIGFLCGRLIKGAVSRQREFLADASAVQFTRNPYGISGALRKIGGYSQGSQIKTPKAEEVSHMLFGTIGKSEFSNPFATHPPLKERIRRLESLSKNAAVMSGLGSSALEVSARNGAIAEGAMGLAGGGSSTPMPPSAFASTNIHINPDQVVTAIGTTDPAHLTYAQAFLRDLPSFLHPAIRNPQGAQAVIFGLLLDGDDPAVGDRQLHQLRQTETLDIVTIAQQTSATVASLDPRTRLPLVDLTIPALRTLTKEDISRFFKQIQMLVRADGRLSLSEYTLQIVLQRRLQPYFAPASQATAIKHTTMGSVWDDCLKILAGLAQVGHSTPDTIAYAFRSGVYCLPESGKHPIPDPPEAPGLYDIGTSLKRLAQGSPKVKQAFVDACAHTVLVDNTVTFKEAELLRAIVISLDCPIPPFLN